MSWLSSVYKVEIFWLQTKYEFFKDLQRKYEDAQDELMTIEHAREDERIHAQIVAKELEDWRQVWERFAFRVESV